MASNIYISSELTKTIRLFIDVAYCGIMIQSNGDRSHITAAWLKVEIHPSLLALATMFCGSPYLIQPRETKTQQRYIGVSQQSQSAKIFNINLVVLQAIT